MARTAETALGTAKDPIEVHLSKKTARACHKLITLDMLSDLSVYDKLCEWAGRRNLAQKYVPL